MTEGMIKVSAIMDSFPSHLAITWQSMDLLFLGTSSGAPTKERNVTALALIPENSKGWYLFDCGEATQHQLQYSSLSVNTLQAILITHVHGDHCYGLPGLLASAAMSGRKLPLTLIAPQAVLAWLAATQLHTALYLPFPLHLLAVEDLLAGAAYAETVWRDEEVSIDLTSLSHRVPSYAYSVTARKREQVLDTQKLLALNLPQGPLWGQLRKGVAVECGGQLLQPADFLHCPFPLRKVVVGGDNDNPALLHAACAGAQVLVHEATYTVEIAKKVGPGVGHSDAARVAAFAQQIGLPNLLLTHFSPRYQKDVSRSPSIAEIEQEARAHYQGALFLAQDFARFHLHKTGQFTRLPDASQA